MTTARKMDSLAPHPRTVSQLVGHEGAEQLLLQAVASGRLPHAWLLTGLPGIGKATLAYRFARFLLAREGGKEGLLLETAFPETLDLSPDHPVARRVAAAGHPDLFVLERSPREDGRLPRDIDVDSVRQLNSFLHMTSAEGGRRVAIVDSADELNANGANALLKLLEEPPPQAVLLLVSHAPGRLLPTLRSRCRQLRLTPLEDGELSHLLRQHLPEADPDQLALLARLAEGSIGRGLVLAAEGGVDLYRELLELLSAMPRLETAKAHSFAEALARDPRGQRLRAAGDLLLWWIARLVEAGALKQLPQEVIEGEGEVMQRLLKVRPLAEWLALWENLGRLFGQAERASLDRKQVMLTALNRLAGASPVVAV